MGKSSVELNDEYEGLDPFDIEVQFALYVRRIYRGKNLKDLPTDQLRQIRQAFYGAWAQCLVVQRDELPDDEDQAVTKLQGMWEQVGRFWTNESRGQN